MEDYTRIKRLVKDIFYDGDYTNISPYVYKDKDLIKLDLGNNNVYVVNNMDYEALKHIMDIMEE